jgi:hypothetical protein
MGRSSNSRRFPIIASLIVLAVVVAGIAYFARQPQLNVLRSDNDGLNVAVISLEDKVSDVSKSLVAYHKIAAKQESVADALRLELDDSLGNRLVMTEAIYQVLPKTISDAQDQGYSLIDKLDSEGNMIEAACFNHEGILHYAKRDTKITAGKEWHGAPFLLAYDQSSEKVMGIVLETISLQSSPPWEYHAHGHPGMDFPHWSLHIWFTDPPKNLSLSNHVH